MDHTILGIYPDIDAVYKSDREIVLICSWEKCSESEGHVIRWEICNRDNEVVYEKEFSDVFIRPWMYVDARVFFNKDIKAALISGALTVKLYFDDNLVKTKTISYSPKSLVNEDVVSAVVLPFSDKLGNKKIHSGHRLAYLNSCSSVLYNEVDRVFADTIPHYVSEREMGGLSKFDCFENKACLEKITQKLNCDIAVAGNLILEEFVHVPSRMKVHVYFNRTGSIREFYYNQYPRTKQTYSQLVQDLVAGILYKTEFREHLRTLQN